jgi:hypothetical protein
MAEKRCVECSMPVRGRADKKFCDDQCRSSHYNRTKIEENNLTKNVNQILKKNRQILSEFNPEGKTRTSRNKLFAAGFNFQYHTQTHLTQKGNTYIFCYEYGYLDLGGDVLLLVKKAAV